MHVKNIVSGLFQQTNQHMGVNFDLNWLYPVNCMGPHTHSELMQLELGGMWTRGWQGEVSLFVGNKCRIAQR